MLTGITQRTVYSLCDTKNEVIWKISEDREGEQSLYSSGLSSTLILHKTASPKDFS